MTIGRIEMQEEKTHSVLQERDVAFGYWSTGAYGNGGQKQSCLMKETV